MLFFERYNLKFLDKKNLKILCQALPPTCLHNVMQVTLSPRHSPSVFCMLQVIKNWRQERPTKYSEGWLESKILTF